MIKDIMFFFSGAALSWLITADHYGHIVRGDTISGIACRINELDAVRVGPIGETETLCIDLSPAIPEQVLWDDLISQIEENFAEPET